MSAIVASIVRVPPAEAAKRLRHLLFGRDIGIVMATKAQHKLGDASREIPSLASFYREDGDAYVGSFLEGVGLVDVRFPKSGCRFLTESEVADLASVNIKIKGPLP